MKKNKIPQILINLSYLLGSWQFNTDRKEYLLGFIYFYLNRHKFKSIKYPFIKYSRSFIRNHHVIMMGSNVTVGYNCFISPIYLVVGDNCWLGVNNFICGKVEIGNDVYLSPNVSIPGASHNIDSELPLSKSGRTVKGTIIEDYVWVGSNVTILDGVRICKGAVVSANSLVSNDVAPYAVVGGIPAKVLRFRPEIRRT